ncbi:hypothetical protein F4824DRAFT_513645 [Ustulina deusta]|nr:hypothetical protein F4824DRAFT_513645 [Ustulina deusta]
MQGIHKQRKTASLREAREQTEAPEATGSQANLIPQQVTGIENSPAARALNGFCWKGRDLHSQRRYLALRLRFRREPYGYMIAHDIHDAVKLSRKRTRKREKEAEKQKKKGVRSDKKSAPRSGPTPATQVSSPPPPHVQFQDSVLRNGESKKLKKKQAINADINREADANHPIGEGESQEVEGSTTKAKKKLAKIFATSPGTTSWRETTAGATPSGVGDPFQGPIPGPEKTKTRTKKAKRKMKWNTASLESLISTRDPSRDLEPMRLIDADDFRLESPENMDWPGAFPNDAILPCRRDRDSRKLGGEDVQKGKRGKKRDKKEKI